MIEICKVENNEYCLLVDHNTKKAFWFGKENIILSKKARYISRNSYGDLITLIKWDK